MPTRDLEIGLQGLAVVLDQDPALRVLAVDDDVVDGFLSVEFNDGSVREVRVGDVLPEVACEALRYVAQRLGRMNRPAMH